MSSRRGSDQGDASPDDDDLDSYEFKPPSNAPFVVALGVVLAGGIAAFIYFGRSYGYFGRSYGKTHKEAPAPLVTTVAMPETPAGIGTPSAVPRAIEATPAPLPTPALPPTPTSLSSSREKPIELSEPHASSPQPPARSQPRPTESRPATPKPAAVAKPNAPIVRDAPF